MTEIYGGEAHCVLLVAPRLSGGTTRHVHEMAAAWSAQGVRTLLLEPAGRLMVLVFYAAGEPMHRLVFPYDMNFLLQMLRESGVELIHYHHVYQLLPDLRDLPRHLDVPYVVTLHDYYTICPAIKLTTPDERYCAEPDSAGCAYCLQGWCARPAFARWWSREGALVVRSVREQNDRVTSTHANRNRGQDCYIDKDVIIEWRRQWHDWLAGASMRLVPHADVQQRLARYFPDLRFDILENPEVVPLPDWLVKDSMGQVLPSDDASQHSTVQHAGPRATSSLGVDTIQSYSPRVRRIGCIGALGLSKGGGRLLACAREASARDLPLEFVLFGMFGADVLEADPGPLPPNLTVTGPYVEAEVYGQITDEDLSFCWFPPFWPETYSYTLSIPIRLGLPVLGSDIGAIGARIREHGWGDTYPWDADTDSMLATLMAFRPADYPRSAFHIENTAFPQATELYAGLWREKGQTTGELPLEAWQSEAAQRTWQNLPWHLTGVELKLLLTHPEARAHLLQIALHTDKAWLLDWAQRHGQSNLQRGVYLCLNKLQRLMSIDFQSGVHESRTSPIDY